MRGMGSRAAVAFACLVGVTACGDDSGGTSTTKAGGTTQTSGTSGVVTIGPQTTTAPGSSTQTSGPAVTTPPGAVSTVAGNTQINDTAGVGAKGPGVVKIQELLRDKWGVPTITVDGIYGTQTEAAVKKFQADHGLGADGIVGSETWRALQAA